MAYDFSPRWMNPELEAFQTSVEKFLDQEMLPQDEAARAQGHVGHELWRRAGELGMLCTDIPAEFGGGDGDFRHEAVIYEAMACRGLTGLNNSVHSIVAHYLLNHGTQEQKEFYLPQLCAGQMVGAIAMTEPGGGSDLQSIKTRAIKKENSYVLNGSKTFISNGFLSELMLVVAKTDPTQRARGVSIFLVDTRELKGFSVGKLLKKVGMKAQDTAELFFDDVVLPENALLGGAEGQGFYQLMGDLPYERLIIADNAMGAMIGAYHETVNYVQGREAFGKKVVEFQNTKFKLAEIAATIRVARAFMDRCIEDYLSGKLDTETASMAKLWMTEQQCNVIDECVQLHGGYGYMEEYLIGRMYADARVQRIYGGTNEIMKEVISRKL
ncbi:MAG: acyl-CoA dehydrogenase family protein [Burkholderiales bacterium]|jgi:acyl-CoA dehydrogenase